MQTAPPLPSAEAHAALGAVRRAARLGQRVQRNLLAGTALTKGDKSPVTVADFGSQAVVCQFLRHSFPTDRIMGEEGASELRSPANSGLAARALEEVRELIPGANFDQVAAWIDLADDAGGGGRFWTLDPIDGTKGFLRGEQYAVALALIVDGVAQVGALACPNLPSRFGVGSVLVATRGGGCFEYPLDDRAGGPPSRVAASPLGAPATARMLESVEAAHGDHSAHARIQQILGNRGTSVRMDSQAKYAELARGGAELYLRLPTSEEYRENLWDHAAGALVIEEAGGRVTDIHGRPLDFTTGRKLTANQGIVASNGRIHDAVVAAVRAARGPS